MRRRRSGSANNYGSETLIASYKLQAAVGLWLAYVSVAAQAAHPLITEDTGTQGTGRAQLELTFERAHDHENGVREHAWRYAATYAYGWRDTMDAIVTVPYQRLRVDDGTVTEAGGIGDVGLDLKWRFYERGTWSAALKPGLVFPTGDETEGLGAGRRQVGAYLIGSVDLAPWGLHLHYGQRRNRNDVGERERIRHVSFAAVREIGSMRLVVDMGKDTAADPSVSRDPTFILGGIIVALGDDVDLDAGYKQALNDAEVDGTWLAGITLRF